MAWTDVVAVIGALSWTIPLGSFLKRKLFKPLVRLRRDKTAEIGYTEMGPVFNFNAAIYSDMPILIEKIECVVSHHNGSRHIFRCHDTHDLAKIDSKGLAVPISAIAIAVDPQRGVQVQLRNRIWNFTKKSFDLVSSLDAEIDAIKRRKGSAADLEATKSFQELRAFYVNGNIWIAGDYSVDISLYCDRPINFSPKKIKFSLSESEAERLSRNEKVSIEQLLKIACIAQFLPSDSAVQQDFSKPEWTWVTRLLEDDEAA